MRCGKCHDELPENSVFCAKCGNRIRAGSDAAGVSMKRPAPMTVLALFQYLGFTISSFAVLAGTMVGLQGEGWEPGPLLIFAALGALQLAAGIGLWRRRPYGRTIQLGMSWIGLLAFPLGTILSALILYYLYRPHVKVLYSGKSERELTTQEIEALTADHHDGLAMALAIGAVVFVCFVGILAAIAIPNFLHAVGRAKQKRTLVDIEAIARSIQSYANEHDRYPVARNLEELAGELVPTHATELPPTDGWGREFLIRSNGSDYRIQSAGGDGIFESDPRGGATDEVAADIVLAGGRFVQWPEGLMP